MIVRVWWDVKWRVMRVLLLGKHTIIAKMNKHTFEFAFRFTFRFTFGVTFYPGSALL